MTDKMWHYALDEAVSALKKCEYDFEKAREFIDGEIKLGAKRFKRTSLTAKEILGLLEHWLLKCDD